MAQECSADRHLGSIKVHAEVCTLHPPTHTAHTPGNAGRGGTHIAKNTACCWHLQRVTRTPLSPSTLKTVLQGLQGHYFAALAHTDAPTLMKAAVRASSGMFCWKSHLVDPMQVVNEKWRELGPWKPGERTEQKLGWLASFVVSEVVATHNNNFDVNIMGVKVLPDIVQGKRQRACSRFWSLAR